MCSKWRRTDDKVRGCRTGRWNALKPHLSALPVWKRAESSTSRNRGKTVMWWQEGLLTGLHADVAHDWIGIWILGKYGLRHLPHVTEWCAHYEIMWPCTCYLISFTVPDEEMQPQVPGQTRYQHLVHWSEKLVIRRFNELSQVQFTNGWFVLN